MKKTLIAGCSLVALLASGCSLIPDYLRPDPPVAAAWPDGPAYRDAPAPGPLSAPAAGRSWRQTFTDPRLQRLIDQALTNNRDLRVAALSVEAARASHGVTESALLPHLTAGASETAERTPKDLSGTVPPQATITRRYDVSLGVASYELDLFGRVRSLEAEALEQYLATDEAQASVRIALVAEVANSYLTLLADRETLAVVEDTVAARQKSHDLISRSFQRGIGSQLDVAQARTALETARASRERTLRQIAQDENALTLLLGAPLNRSRYLDGATLDDTALVGDVPVGLPSEVILRRPDIRQAEHQLKAANANIGAARAAFFPSISLTGTVGTASAKLSDLFAGGSGAWSFAPQISVPIFDYGRNESTLEEAKANQKIAVARYEKAIQSAFREVADALAARGTLTNQLAAQKALVDAARLNFRLAQARYEHGVDSYLATLDAQRSLLSAQEDEIAVRAGRLANLVTLYKVLGGDGRE